MKITVADKLIILTWIILIALIFFFEHQKKGSKTVQVIYKNKYSYYNISDSKNIKLKNDKIEIQIKNNSVRIIESDCLQQICVNSGEISKIGNFLVCLPNKLFIRIISKKNKHGVDAIVR